jgi:hypothetical protein
MCHAFPERMQRRDVLRNDAWGRIVPVAALAAEVGVKRETLRPRRLL